MHDNDRLCGGIQSDFNLKILDVMASKQINYIHIISLRIDDYKVLIGFTIHFR